MRVILVLSGLFFWSVAAHAQLSPGDFATTLVPFGSDWRYLAPLGLAENPEVGNPDFRTTWATPEFNDAAWVGPASAPLQYGGVGAHDPEEGTTLPTPPAGERFTYYFRHEFTLDKDVARLEVQAQIDDGAVFYLDGQRIEDIFCCDNDPPAFDDLANPPAAEAELFTFLLSVDDLDIAGIDLSAGTTHTLAAEVHQVDPSSSDLGFDLRLIQNGPGMAWNVDEGGEWESFSNWQLLARPNNVGDVAYFGDVITQPRTVVTDFIDGDGNLEPFEVSGIEFDSPITYALAGSGPVNLVSNDGPSTVRVSRGEHELQAPLNVANDIEFHVADGAKLELNNTLQLNGFTMSVTGNGELAINNLELSTPLALAAATLTGQGAVGALQNEGQFDPDGFEQFQIVGDYTQATTGALILELSATGYDSIAVGGTAQLAGDLHIEIVGDFTPEIGDEFLLIQADEIEGDFERVVLPELNRYSWDTSQLSETGRLSVVGVPEPSPLACLILSLGAMWFRLRNR